jgi:hypothetical protein
MFILVSLLIHSSLILDISLPLCVGNTLEWPCSLQIINAIPSILLKKMEENLFNYTGISG